MGRYTAPQMDSPSEKCYNLVSANNPNLIPYVHRRVPEDLAIVGHDDIPLAALVSPALTTCRVPRYELGAMAVNTLLERLEECPGGCRQSVLQTELIIRESAPWDNPPRKEIDHVAG